VTKRILVTAAGAALALALGLTLGACSGGDDGSDADDKTPDEVAAAAVAKLTETTGVQLTLETKALPEGINGIMKAEGLATDAPAFEGSLTVTLSGQAFEVPVAAVDDLVCAQIPLTPGWSDVDPAEYGAPDPAGFLSPDDGFAAILEAATGLTKGETIRGGSDNDEILTTYNGSVPGAVVDRVIPGASGDFDIAAQIADDDELRSMSMTGVFYEGADANTYTVGFDGYGATEDIKAPCSPA
jgi:lipoprotein LprG